MGEKKRKPLRSHGLTDRPSKNLKVASTGGDGKGHKAGTSTAKGVELVCESAGNANEDEWERIERQQQSPSSGTKYGDSGDDEDDEDEDDEIRLEGSIQHVTEKYTFEFNDMRDEYTEGICVLLRSLVQNPTKAYELAKTISSQSMLRSSVLKK